MMTSHTASAPSRVSCGANRQARRARVAAARAQSSVRLLAMTVVLVTLALGLSAALRGATSGLVSQMSMVTEASAQGR